MALSRKTNAHIAVALCALVLAGCSSYAFNPSTQIGSTSTPADSTDQYLTTQTSALTAAQNRSRKPEFTEIMPNEALSCSGTLAEFKVTFLNLLNEVRSEARRCGNTSHNPVASVRWNDNLHAAALRHSNDMSSNDFFSHTGSDSSTVAERVDAAGYPWQTVGENIAAGQRSAKEAMDGWLSSPGHCRNIMSPHYEEVGVTCVSRTRTEYTTYWTNVFGSEFE